MDDFILILKSKKDCIKYKALIERFLWEHLKLELNLKSKYYPHKMGVNFCGYRIFTTHKLLRLSSKKKIKKKVKKWNIKFSEGTINYEKTIQSLNSWLGHSSHCNSYKLQQKILKKCNFLYQDSTYEIIEKNLIQDIASEPFLE